MSSPYCTLLGCQEPGPHSHGTDSEGRNWTLPPEAHPSHGPYGAVSVPEPACGNAEPHDAHTYSRTRLMSNDRVKVPCGGVPKRGRSLDDLLWQAFRAGVRYGFLRIDQPYADEEREAFEGWREEMLP